MVIGPLVILNAAQDLMPVADGDEVLSFGFAQDRRCAQDGMTGTG